VGVWQNCLQWGSETLTHSKQELQVYNVGGRHIVSGHLCLEAQGLGKEVQLPIQGLPAQEGLKVNE